MLTCITILNIILYITKRGEKMKEYRKIYWNCRMHKMHLPGEFMEAMGISKNESVEVELIYKKKQDVY